MTKSPFPFSTLPYAVAAKAPKGEWQPTPPRPAAIVWRDGQPHSLEYDDCYFSRHGGLAESRYVFLEGIGFEQLCKERFARTAPLCIAELGFGSGLNFLATLEAWHAFLGRSSEHISHNASSSMRDSSQAFRLEYLAFEQYPLSMEDICRAHALFPEVAPYAQALQQHYPPCIAGMQQVEFPEYRTKLTVVFGALQEFLPLVLARVDAWYLDGFAPAKNKSMWEPAVFKELARLSNPQARFASFSAARVVKDGLRSIGCSLEKRAGFAHKREMLCGRLDAGSAQESTSRPRATALPARVAIIGAGLAGAALASAFAKRGFQVEVFEQQSEIAQGASGNPAAVLMPYLSVKADFLSRFYLAGFSYTRSVLAQLANGDDIFTECGVLRLATSSRLARLQESLAEHALPEEFVRTVDAKEASELSGVGVELPGFWHASSGLLRPRALVAALLRHPRIAVHTNCAIDHLQQEQGHWQLRAESSTYAADIVVLANAYCAGKFSQSTWLPLEPVKGQLSYLSPTALATSLRSVLCYEGYLMPATLADTQQVHVLGSSYEHDAESLDCSDAVAAEIQAQLLARVPEFAAGAQQRIKRCGERASYRSMSPDRMPLVGQLPVLEEFEQAYLSANGGKLAESYPADGRYSGLFLSLGHGSRGMASCLLSAEVLAASVSDQHLGLEADLVRAVDPARFLVRALKRGIALDTL